MKLLRALLLLLTFLFAQPAQAQKSLNEGSVEIMGHSLGLGFSYRRTLDMTYYNEFHGLLSTGITSGLFSSYVGMGYRRMVYIR